METEDIRENIKKIVTDAFLAADNMDEQWENEDTARLIVFNICEFLELLDGVHKAEEGPFHTIDESVKNFEIFLELRKKYTDEEIADAHIFPTTQEEKDIAAKEFSEFIRQHKLIKLQQELIDLFIEQMIEDVRYFTGERIEKYNKLTEKKKQFDNGLQPTS